MKSVCFVCWDFSITGGAEKVAAQLSNSLSNYYNVHVVSLCNKNHRLSYTLNSKISYYNVIDGETRIRCVFQKSFLTLRKYLVKNKIDIVMLIGNYTAPLVLALKPFVPAKFVFCDHGALLNEIEKKKITAFRKIAAKFCDKVIVLTERDLADYKKIFKLKEDKIKQIYDHLDDEIFKHVADKYDEDSRKIITVGRFTKEKGFDMLVDVAKIVLNRHQDWEWHIYGDGEEFDNIKSLVENNNLQSRLILKGATQSIYEKYKEYSIYVLPSYREGLSLVLLEAKANRLPTVSFDCIAGPNEIIQHNIDGFLIPCYDKQAMADKICTLIENPELRERFSENSRTNLNKFDKETILTQWRELIDNLL